MEIFRSSSKTIKLNTSQPVAQLFPCLSKIFYASELINGDSLDDW